MSSRRTALAIGTTGVVGCNLLQYLLTLGEWDVISLFWRIPDVTGDYQHISVNLLEPTD